MLQNLLLNIDAGTIDWSRAQFALTAIYHWLFVPLTLGLAVIMGIAETKYYRTKDEFWKTTAKFWQRLFGINFASDVLWLEEGFSWIPPCFYLAHRLRRNYLSVVDSGGQRVDAVSRGLRVQSRHHAQRDGIVC